MRRRDFVRAIVGLATAWPLAARAQQSAVRTIGFLNTRTQSEAQNVLSAFRQGLAETNAVEGQNVKIEYRWGEDQYDRVPALAADLVRRQVALIVANGPAAVAAKAATSEIPIVFYTAGDPVRMGFVSGLNQPGGNLTGVTTLGSEIGSKRIELLHQIVPSASTVAVVVNPKYSITETESQDMGTAVQKLGLKSILLHASNDNELEAAFAVVAGLQVGGLAIGSDPFFSSRTEQLGKLATRFAVPSVYQYRDFAAAGGLMSYGVSDFDLYRSVGVIAGRILKGDKPSNIPVQQSTKVELIINLKAAKALGLSVPQSLLSRADEVIE
jgi:putative tryptophan/tyrosine transport system substrate-binding protein